MMAVRTTATSIAMVRFHSLSLANFSFLVRVIMANMQTPPRTVARAVLSTITSFWPHIAAKTPMMAPLEMMVRPAGLEPASLAWILSILSVIRFNSSNFFAIKDNRYITPKSDSILPSITNMSLETVAAHLGMEVERREVLVDELSTFEEVGECGTAVVITPVHKLVDKPFLESEEETVYTYGDGKCGPKSLRLYNFITQLQKGDIEDPFGWIHFVE